jgi:tetratricopeptide (TPR) repeat protein
MTSNENTTDVLVTRSVSLPKKLDIILRTIGHGSGASKNEIIRILIVMELAEIKPDDELFDLTSSEDATTGMKQLETVHISFYLPSRLDAQLRDLAEDKKLSGSDLIQNLLERYLRRPDCIFRKYLDPSHLGCLFPSGNKDSVDHLIDQVHCFGVESYDYGSYADALRSFEEEFKISLENGRDTFRARKFAAMLQTSLNRYDEAEENLKFLSDAIRKDEVRISDVEKIEVLNALARVYRIRGKWTECDKIIAEAEATAKDSSAVAVKLAHIHTKEILVECYFTFGKHSAAKKTALEALPRRYRGRRTHNKYRDAD